MKRLFIVCAVALLGIGAADHVEGLPVVGDPATNIAGFYGWVDGSANRVVYVLNVYPGASASSMFSTTTQYVIHTSSTTAFGAADAAAPSTKDIIATFDAKGIISLWVGTDAYANGDASSEEGITSTHGNVQVFAGLRADPFFFNAQGFQATTSTIAQAKGSEVDDAGCPQLDAAAATALTTSLATTDGDAAVDSYADATVLSIVVSLDPSLVTNGGPVVSAWASTNVSGS